jgi:hypothetical protein
VFLFFKQAQAQAQAQAQTGTNTHARVSKKMPSSSSSSSSTALSRPANWQPGHDAFIRRLARNGEDANSILILFETEFPAIKVSRAWIAERMKASVM